MIIVLLLSLIWYPYFVIHFTNSQFLTSYKSVWFNDCQRWLYDYLIWTSFLQRMPRLLIVYILVYTNRIKPRRINGIITGATRWVFNSLPYNSTKIVSITLNYTFWTYSKSIYQGSLKSYYRSKSIMKRTKSPSLNVLCLAMQLSLPNPLKPRVKSRMKMQLEQRLQMMFQLHLSDYQVYCPLSLY